MAISDETFLESARKLLGDLGISPNVIEIIPKGSLPTVHVDCSGLSLEARKKTSVVIVETDGEKSYLDTEAIGNIAKPNSIWGETYIFNVTLENDRSQGITRIRLRPSCNLAELVRVVKPYIPIREPAHK